MTYLTLAYSQIYAVVHFKYTTQVIFCAFLKYTHKYTLSYNKLFAQCVDLTSGRRPRWVARYSGWGGGSLSVRLKPYYQTSAWDGAATVLHCLSLCLNTIQYRIVQYCGWYTMQRDSLAISRTLTVSQTL